MLDSRALTVRREALAQRRRGAVVVLAAFCLAILMAMVAFAVDVGYLMVAKTDLQRAADAAAHAAVLEYRSEESPSFVIPSARSTARQYVEDNKVLNATATVATNSNNADVNGDIVVGRIDFDNPRNPMTFGDTDRYNAIRVRIRRSTDRNGEVPLFFARVLGHESLGLEAEATAALVKNVSGFQIPGSRENVPFLPITIRVDYWEAGLAAANDDWAFNSSNQSISESQDGVPEVVLFPNSTESAGNYGTLNVGVSANSTSHIANQIRNGLSQSDLDFHGGELALNSSGELPLTGDPGISASIKDDLAAIAGKPVVIPLYREVAGNGNNAVFVITEFVGVRVMAVRLTGGEKFLSVQPANVTFNGTIQAASGLDGTSKQIYSPPVIVQ